MEINFIGIHPFYFGDGIFLLYRAFINEWKPLTEGVQQTEKSIWSAAPLTRARNPIAMQPFTTWVHTHCHHHQVNRLPFTKHPCDNGLA
jgi:hypothetical protein